jgi:hypothetical protein
MWDDFFEGKRDRTFLRGYVEGLKEDTTLVGI